MSLTMHAHAVTVDWLVLYDEGSKKYYNDDPQTAMQNWVSRINTMYTNSQVDIQLRLVGVLPLATNGDDQSEVLRNLRTNKEANRLRDARGADIVTQLYHEGNCGIGFATSHPNYAWNVVRAACGAASTAAHELGHNMGLNHSRRQGNTGGVRYSYGLGYGVDNQFATLMAYTQAFNARRLNQFSNPNLRCSDLPCGVKEGDAEQANAVLALQNSRFDIAAYRSPQGNGNSFRVTVDTNKTKYNYDFGTATSPIQNGWVRVSPETNGDIAWSGRVNARDRGDIDGVNQINRDFTFSNGRRVFSHKIANGTWGVIINMGDARHRHDNMSVKAEGQVKHANVGGEAGEFPYANFDVVVNDGELNIEFEDAGGADGNWVLNRISLNKKAGPSNSNNGNVVQLRKRNAMGFAIDGSGNNRNGQSVYLWSQNRDNRNQQWIEINRGNGFYSYRKNGTQYCIDGGNGGANKQDVILWSCNADNQNQHWRKIDRGNGFYSFEKRNAPGFSLDGRGGGSNRQNIYLWQTQQGNQNQQWATQ